jgi:hypothetical protein
VEGRVDLERNHIEVVIGVARKRRGPRGGEDLGMSQHEKDILVLDEQPRITRVLTGAEENRRVHVVQSGHEACGREKLRTLGETDGTQQLRGYVGRYGAKGGILGASHLELSLCGAERAAQMIHQRGHLCKSAQRIVQMGAAERTRQLIEHRLAELRQLAIE